MPTAPSGAPESLKERSGTVVRARRWALSITGGIVGLAYVGNEARRILTMTITWHELTYLLLLVTTLVLVGMWIYASEQELDLLFRFLKTTRYTPPSDLKETLMIVGLAIFAALLLVSARSTHLFGTLYFYYLLLDLGSWNYRLQEIRLAVEESPSSVPSAVNAIRSFYFERPHTIRVQLLLAGAFPAACTAWVGYVEQSALLTSLANLGFVAIIVAGEAPLALWRQRYYAACSSRTQREMSGA